MSEHELDTVSTAEEKEQASAQGWKEEARDDFKTAHDFLEFGNKVAPIQKERNEHLSREITELKRSNEQMKEAFFKSQHTAKEEGYKKAKSDLLAEQKRAFDNVDEPAHKEATEKLEKLEPPKEEQPVKKAEADPEWAEWVTQNSSWYGTDVVMTGAANAIGEVLGKQSDLTGTAFYNEVLKLVKKEFPHKFGNQNRNNANTVEAGGQTTTKPNGKKGYANLPADIKAGTEHAMATFGYKTKEEYATAYWRESDKYGWEA